MTPRELVQETINKLKECEAELNNKDKGFFDEAELLELKEVCVEVSSIASGVRYALREERISNN